MHEFSTLDGFVDITECAAEMIKYVANEPSVGLFYVQQHTHSAVPNVVRLRNKVADKSHETTLHAEDSEDSIEMVRSMKECGFPIADEMIRDIKKTLAVMSSKQPRRGLIRNSRPGGLAMERASSWGPAGWGQPPGVYGRDDGERSGYFSSVFMSAKKKATNFKWPPLDSTVDEVQADELPLSSRIADELREKRDDVSSSSGSHDSVLPEGENYDKFKADKEAKLEEWLGGNARQDNQ